MSCRSVQTDPRIGLWFLTSFLALAVRVHLRPCDGKGGWEPCWVTPWIPGSWQDEPLYRVSTKKYMSLLINMGADTQRNAFPGSVTNQLLRHCEVTPSPWHRLWYSPPAPPLSLYHPLACLIDILVLLKLTMLPYFLQLYNFFYLCVWCVWCVCVCVCSCVLWCMSENSQGYWFSPFALLELGSLVRPL